MPSVTLSPAPAPRPAPPTIETARLRLRPWRPEDTAAYGRLLRDDELMRYLGSGVRYRLKRTLAGIVAAFSDLEARRAIRTLIQHWDRHGFGEWAAEEKGTGRLVGKIGLHHHPDWAAEETKVEVGWLLARDAWGQGYATEGGVASLEDAFERVRLDRVLSIAQVENGRSVRVMERIGLTPVGRTRWRRSEVCWYAIDRDEWERRRGNDS